jgi:hypothetical protein
MAEGNVIGLFETRQDRAWDNHMLSAAACMMESVGIEGFQRQATPVLLRAGASLLRISVSHAANAMEGRIIRQYADEMEVLAAAAEYAPTDDENPAPA